MTATSAPPPLSLVVVTWNSARELTGLLATIGAHLNGAFEVVIADNGSEDETLEVAGAWEGPIRILALGKNLGFGAANNAGVGEARHDAVVLLNPDTLLVDGSLGALARLALDVGGLCGPAILNEDETRQPSASAPPGGWELAVNAVLPGPLMPRKLQSRCQPWRSDRRTHVGWLTGACIAAPRRVLLELGPFDERIHLYGEDLDLSLRAASAGIPRIFAPDVARIVHLGSRSAAKRFGDDGAAVKVRNRRAIVARRLGRGRERLDFCEEGVFHVTRYLGKTVLRRDALPERRWLRAALLARSGTPRSTAA